MKDASLILSSGRKLGYAEFGDPEGLPTFYFHGWPCSRLHAKTMHEEALRQGVRLVCPDRPGLGLSDAHPERRLSDWPQLVVELAEHLGWTRFHLLGVSGGGPYALVCAAMIPDRLHSAQVICGAPPIHDIGERHLFWIYRLLIKLRRRWPKVLGMALLAGASLATHPAQYPPVRALIRLLPASDQCSLSVSDHYQTISGSYCQAVCNGTDSVITDADIYLNPWPFRLNDVNYPIHFWHGLEDRNISWRCAHQMACRLPNAVTHWLPEEGHYSLPINQAGEILRVLKERDPSEPAPKRHWHGPALAVS